MDLRPWFIIHSSCDFWNQFVAYNPQQWVVVAMMRAVRVRFGPGVFINICWYRERSGQVLQVFQGVLSSVAISARKVNVHAA